MSELYPEEQAFLDEAVERLTPTRYTFTEREALQPAFDEGYDLDLNYDPRFVNAELKRGEVPPHWCLTTHTLANNRLLNDIQTGAWDGRNLESYLAQLDEQTEQRHHIFYAHDPRFIYKQGVWNTTAERQLVLPPELKAELDAFTEQLKARILSGGKPLTIAEIIEHLRELGWSKSDVPNAFRYVRSWLLGLGIEQIQRVNQDYWIVAKMMPADIQRKRLQVPLVRTPDGRIDKQQSDSTGANTHQPEALRHQEKEYSNKEEKVILDGTATNPRSTWPTELRTINLNEGFITVPKDAQGNYPPLFPGEKDKTVLRGRWYEDGDRIWVWLDREHHRLYGPDLLEKIAYQNTGDRLQVQWQPDEIVFRIVGYNDEVNQEETRFVDLEELKQLRQGLGESYRQSLQAILTDTPQGLTFAEIMPILRQRQQHQVSCRTVRAILYGGGFIHHQQRWFAAPDNESGSHQLRTAILDTYVPEEALQIPPSSPEYVRSRAKAIYQRLTEINQILRTQHRLS